MDPVSQAKLDRLLATDIGSLTETDKSFLRARKTYIPNKKQQELKSVLGGSDPVVEPVEEVKREDWSEHPADKSSDEQTESVDDEEDDEAEG